jgi:hypothetical protein
LLFGHKYRISKWVIVGGTVYGAHSVNYYGELIYKKQQHPGLDFSIHRSLGGAISRGVAFSLVLGLVKGWIMASSISRETNLWFVIISGAILGIIPAIVSVILGWKFLERVRYQTLTTAGYRYM